MEELAPVLGITSFFAVIGWIIRMFLFNRRQLKIANLQADLNKQMIEKFDSAEELRRFLESDSGKVLVDSAPIERRSPYGRILGSLQAGIIMVAAGLACLFLQNHIPDGAEAFVFLGAMGFALGLGFLISAGAAYGLSKTWGLINGGNSHPGTAE